MVAITKRPENSKEKHGSVHFCCMETWLPDITCVVKATEVNEKSHANCDEGPTGIVSKKSEPTRIRLDADEATAPPDIGKHKASCAVEKAPAGKGARYA